MANPSDMHSGQLESNGTTPKNTEVENPVILAASQLDMESTTSEDHDPEPPVPLTEFRVFPKLPAELRLKVWKFAKPGPRIVKIRGVGQGGNPIHTIYKNMTPPPAPLFVCQESRVEYLKWYRQLVTVESLRGRPTELQHYQPSAIYFDPTCDTLDYPAACIYPDIDPGRTFMPGEVKGTSAGSQFDLLAFEKEEIKNVRIDVTDQRWQIWDECSLLLYQASKTFRGADTATLFIVRGQRVASKSTLEYILRAVNEVFPDWDHGYLTAPRGYQEVPYDKDGNVTKADNSVSPGGDIKLLFDWAE